MHPLFYLQKLALDLFFPETCAKCGKLLNFDEPGVCAECWRSVRGLSGHFCLRCGSNYDVDQNRQCARCIQGKNLFKQACSLGYHEPPLNELVSRFKYGEGLRWHRRQKSMHMADFLGARMARLLPLRKHISHSALIVPVPIHANKLAERGFNQSEILAAAIARKTGLPLDTVGLIRIVETQTQAKLDARQRLENVKDAFAVINPLTFIEQNILLIDDVLTTGATINACAGKLLEAGAQQVCVMTIARAAGSDDK